jgi:hypothetical protein
MTGKEFLRAVANGKIDLLRVMLDVLAETGAAHCVIGGLAVNAYVEPVVSLDVDIVVAQSDLARVRQAAEARGLRSESFPHSINLSAEGSDLRVQLQTDARYQAFLPRARPAEILGYTLPAAAKEDVLQGKIWAWSDATRRRSKRQKDLADIGRLVEADPTLEQTLPEAVRRALNRD